MNYIGVLIDPIFEKKLSDNNQIKFIAAIYAARVNSASKEKGKAVIKDVK